MTYEQEFLIEHSDHLYVRMKAHVGTVYYDPSNDVTVTREPTMVKVTEWVIEQLEAGTIEECDAPAPVVEEPAAETA